MTRSIQTLMAGLVDYAGLFPPAKLSMRQAVENYARYRISEQEWMLGRFIVPVSRLEEFTACAGPLLPGTFARSGYRDHAQEAAEPWPVSALLDGDLAADLKKIYAFNDRHAEPDHGQCQVDCVELKVAEAGGVDTALDVIPEELFPFFEFPSTADCRGFVTALTPSPDDETGGAAAKIRTGGTTGDAFPSAQHVAAFLHACAAAEVPFKATAGLHHALRGSYPLTYEPGAAKGLMHGFVNLFVAASLVRARKVEPGVTAAILEDGDARHFVLGEETAGWKNIQIGVAQLAECREAFALSFGSCSFEEPGEELRGLKLL
jgi:hypothetical protein